jgi:hypothetical protein
MLLQHSRATASQFSSQDMHSSQFSTLRRQLQQQFRQTS